MTGSWPWYAPADYAELEERNEMLAKELAEANDSLDRIKPQRDAMQQAIRDQEAELAEATARVIITDTDVIECMLGDDGIWQCSLREWQKRPHAYAHDEDPIAAIRKAVNKIGATPDPEDDHAR